MAWWDDIPEDPVISSMLRTGFPSWIDDSYPSDEDDILEDDYED